MIAGVCMVRDEADVVAATIGAMLDQVDEVIVADNGSTDGTRDILATLPVTVIDDPDPAYYQSRKMTALARRAAGRGATWVVPFDADEVWYSPFHDRIATFLKGIAPQWLCASAALYDHVATALDDPGDTNPITRLTWRRPEPAPLPKVACRIRPDLVIEQGNHAARYQGGATVHAGELVIRHFPYRSPDHFVRKALNGLAAYRATDLPDSVGAHWRQYGELIEHGGPQVGADIFHEWFHEDDPAAAGLVYDPCPTSR